MMAEDIPSLRFIFGGEACAQHLIEKWQATSQTPEYIWTYRSYSNCHIFGIKTWQKGYYRPASLQLRRLYMREDGSFAPQGDAGELLIGGIGLARGYIGHEDLNKEKFIEIQDV